MIEDKDKIAIIQQIKTNLVDNLDFNDRKGLILTIKQIRLELIQNLDFTSNLNYEFFIFGLLLKELQLLTKKNKHN